MQHGDLKIFIMAHEHTEAGAGPAVRLGGGDFSNIW